MGHTDELWALATHPTLTQFVTAGQDCLLQMWDSLSHSVVWSKDIGVIRNISNLVKLSSEDIIKSIYYMFRKNAKAALSLRMVV